MLMFHKNGQGFFDFDFEYLESITSIEFTSRVKAHLDEFHEELKTIVLEERKIGDKNWIIVLTASNYRMSEFDYMETSERITERTFGMANALRIFEAMKGEFD